MKQGESGLRTDVVENDAGAEAARESVAISGLSGVSGRSGIVVIDVVVQGETAGSSVTDEACSVTPSVAVFKVTPMFEASPNP